MKSEDDLANSSCYTGDMGYIESDKSNPVIWLGHVV